MYNVKIKKNAPLWHSIYVSQDSIVDLQKLYNPTYRLALIIYSNTVFT